MFSAATAKSFVMRFIWLHLHNFLSKCPILENKIPQYLNIYPLFHALKQFSPLRNNPPLGLSRG